MLVRDACFPVLFVAGIVCSAPAIAQEARREDGPVLATAERLSYPASFFASASPATAFDMVTRVPGFRLEEGDDARGLAGAAGNVFINGARPASKGESLQSMLARIPAAQVSRIDLLRGGAGGVDAQGRSTIVDVVLVAAPVDRGAIQADLAAYEGGPVQLGAQFERSGGDNDRQWSLQLFRGLYPNDSTGWGVLTREDAARSETLREDADNAFQAVTHGARLDWSGPWAKGQFETSLSALLTNYEDRIHYLGPDSFRRFAFEMDLTNVEVGAIWRRPLKDGARLEARFLQTIGGGELVSNAAVDGASQIFATERFTSETAARMALTFSRNESSSLEFGVEAAFNLLDATQSFVADGAVVPLPEATTRVDELRAEGFGLATWRITRGLRAESGLRVEASRISQSGDGDLARDFTYFKPRAALSYSPDDRRVLRVSVSRDVGQINFLDFAASTTLVNDQVLGGNLNLRPDQRWSAEISYERRFANEGVVLVAWRHEALEDVVDFLPLEGGLSARGNIGDGVADRAKLEWRMPLVDLGMRRARISLAASSERARVTDPTTGEKRGISFQAPSSVQFKFDNEVPRHRLTWGFSYEPYSRSPTYDPDQTRFYRVRDQWTAYVEAIPALGWSARLEASLWDDLRIPRTVFADRSAPRPVAFREVQIFDPRDLLSLRIRRKL